MRTRDKNELLYDHGRLEKELEEKAWRFSDPTGCICDLRDMMRQMHGLMRRVIDAIPEDPNPLDEP